MRSIFYSLAVILFAATAQAQEAPKDQKFMIVLDTAGVAATGPDIYTTWVYAVTSPTSYPSSAILVAFDCTHQKVMRLAHVVYRWNATKTGIEGPVIEETNPAWVDISIPKMFEKVCSIGRTKASFNEAPTKPAQPKFVDPRVRST